MILSEQMHIARYNIGRKAVPNAFVADGIEGVGNGKAMVAPKPVLVKAAMPPSKPPRKCLPRPTKLHSEMLARVKIALSPFT
jgi:hypothetical protein